MPETSTQDGIIEWDRGNGQLLSSLCCSCSEEHFQSVSEELPPIGCCRYEPVFTLFEFWRMIKVGNRSLLANIRFNPNNQIFPYEIIVGASIHPLFFKKGRNGEIPYEEYKELLGRKGGKYQAVDLRLRYATCSFFQEGKGCGIMPIFKTSICRMFICDSIEEHLNPEKLKSLRTWQKEIREEADGFHRQHSEKLREKGIDFIKDWEGAIHYLESI